MSASLGSFTASYYPALIEARNTYRENQLKKAQELSPGVGEAAALEALRKQEAKVQRFVYVKNDQVNSIFGIPLTGRTDTFYEKKDITKAAVSGALIGFLSIIFGLGLILSVVFLI